MSFNADQLAALEAAYAAGVTSVSHAGKTVQFASLADLWTAILRLRAALRPASRRHRAGVIRYSRF